jgi:hypothetical protein
MVAQLAISKHPRQGSDSADDDGSGTLAEGTHSITGADDAMGFVVSGTITPAVAQTVNVDFDMTGGDLNSQESAVDHTVTADPDTGAFTFPSVATDDIPDNTSETLTITVSSASHGDSVIVIKFQNNAP